MDLVSYALLTSEDLDDSEPKSYKEAMGSKDKKQCVTPWVLPETLNAIKRKIRVIFF